MIAKVLGLIRRESSGVVTLHQREGNTLLYVCFLYGFPLLIPDSATPESSFLSFLLMTFHSFRSHSASARPYHSVSSRAFKSVGIVHCCQLLSTFLHISLRQSSRKTDLWNPLWRHISTSSRCSFCSSRNFRAIPHQFHKIRCI